MSRLEVRNLSAGYAEKKIIQNLNFVLEEGALTAILGANGCGKTTLLKCICSIMKHEGSCILDGYALEEMNAREIAENISYIPQRSGITIDISVLDVVLMGFNTRLKLLEQPTKKMKEEALFLLERVGLKDRAEENYMHLSEGQKQLCIMARTLASQGSLLLLDEPESALDFRYRYRILSIISDWLKEGKRSALVALHDPMLALNCCDCLILMEDGSHLHFIRPKEDPTEEMEQKLSLLYGPVSLHACIDRQGNEQRIMLKEEK